MVLELSTLLRLFHYPDSDPDIDDRLVEIRIHVSYPAANARDGSCKNVMLAIILPEDVYIVYLLRQYWNMASPP